MRELYSEGDLEQALKQDYIVLNFRWGSQPVEMGFPCRKVIEAILAGEGGVSQYNLSESSKMSWVVGYAGRLKQISTFLDNTLSSLVNPINSEEGDFTALFPLADYYYRAQSRKLAPKVLFDHFFMTMFTCVGDDAFSVAPERRKVAFPLTPFSPSPYYLLREIKVLDRKTIYSFSLLVAELDCVERLLEGREKDIIRLPIFGVRGAIE